MLPSVATTRGCSSEASAASRRLITRSVPRRMPSAAASNENPDNTSRQEWRVMTPPRVASRTRDSAWAKPSMSPIVKTAPEAL